MKREHYKITIKILASKDAKSSEIFDLCISRETSFK